MRDEDLVFYGYGTAMMVLATAMLLLSGCASVQARPDQNYLAPTPPPAPEQSHTSDGSIWAGTQSIALFEDQKARRIGDVLTILLVEKTDASKKASTNTSKESSVDLGNPTLFGRPLTVGGTPVGAFSIDGSRSFNGGGDSSQSNKLEGSVSVVVSQVLANGNLVVRGEKNLELNQGSERVSIQGIVRPIDISPSNTVSSDRVADARISYSGKGSLADSNQPGWLARFFDSPWMPF